MSQKDIVQKSYDDLPYFSKSFSKTQAGLQAAILQMIGHESPAIETARVLEIGCSFGGNIIPFALAYPKAKVVGVDLSEVQIQKGKEVIERIGLSNIELLHKNILDFDASYGKFDYIICHGVFSWVKPEVQDGILKVIKEHLSPKGSAVISYNTYPGWKSQDTLRDLINLRVDSLLASGYELNPTECVDLSKEALSLLIDSPFIQESVKNAAKEILEKDNYYFYHEYLETSNQPMLLRDFQDKLLAHGLSHVIDSDFARSMLVLDNQELADKIKYFSQKNHILREQYYDFVCNRMFRSSIITHLENLPSCNTTPDIRIQDLEKLHLRASLPKNEKGEPLFLGNEVSEEYKGILESIEKSYPSTISVVELRKLHAEDSHFYEKILHLLHKNVVEFSKEKRELRKQEKLAINPSYLNYISYFRETANPVIGFSNYAGMLIELSQVDLVLLPLFDGSKTDAEIEEEILRLDEEKILVISPEENKEKRIVAKNTVANYRFFIERNFLNAPNE